MVGVTGGRRAVLALVVVLAAGTWAAADEPLTAAERKQLQKEAAELNNQAVALADAAKPAEGAALARQALAIFERLYPRREYPDGHPDLAGILNDLGFLIREMGEYGKALPYFEQALGMNQLLYPAGRFKDGHPDLARSLNNLSFLLWEMGEHGKALPYQEQALAMRRRLYPPGSFPDGHPDLVSSLNNLGLLLQDVKEYGKALPLFEEALAMDRRLYPTERYPDGHPRLATGLNNLGILLKVMGEYRKALPYLEQALAMKRRLYPPDRYKDGHPHLAHSLNNLGNLLHSMGEYGKALPYHEQALAMTQRLYPADPYKDGHPDLASSLDDLGYLLQAMGEYGKALPHLKRGLEMYARQAQREAAAAPEAQALALLSYPPTRDSYLDAVLRVPEEGAATVYDQVWPTKGVLLQLVARRHQAALIAAADSPPAREAWERLTDVRRRLNRLASDPGRDPVARQRLLVALTEEQEKCERDLLTLLPTLERQRRLATLGPKDLRDKLGPGSAFMDFVRHGQWEKNRFRGYRYQAFVLASGHPVRRVDLGDAQPVDDAVASWRRAVDRNEASNAPARLKELVWDKLAATLPPGTTTVYLCPDGDLARLPWAALPGAKPGTVLLEDVAVAVVPSGRWLLEQLLYPHKDAAGPDAIAATGAIDYGTAPDGKKAGYPPLAETGRELKRVLEAFGADGLRGGAATPAALKERLAKARYAHLATHGYFDAAAVTAEAKRQKDQMEKWQFGLERVTARVGVRQHPLALVGLALAGANDPKQDAILTGLGIVDLPLENLRLCVLSACETGLGELTEAEGVVGLQRAFHVAGCPNVIGSLWKVDDAATAALMAQFYHELRVNKKSPLEALREAQLTVYRHPERIEALAGERGRPALEEAAKLGSAAGPVKPDDKPKTAPTKLWAAFVLSGVGMK